MASTSEHIIKSLEKEFPRSEINIPLKDCVEYNFYFQTKEFYQYVIGVTPMDRISNDISMYQKNIQESLKDISANLKFQVHGYEGYDKELMETTLRELGEYFKIELDAKKIIKGLKIPGDDSGRYYIVVTIICYPIVFVE